MCGITGIYSFKGPVSHEAVERFTDALEHRGPDGRGIHIDGEVGLGHRRLAILDLSDAGKCPMRYVTPSGRELYITFNGEIYNFLEIRRELISKGYRFISNTDTEVIIAAYAEWGEKCLSRFNGMWAFAIFDPLSRELFLSRDRFGVKPLYLHTSSKLIAFASEIKAFLSIPEMTLTFNENIVRPLWERYRYDGRTPDTAASEIISIPAGHNVRISKDGRVDLKQWWDTSAVLPIVPDSYEEQIELFRELFLDAVRIRMRSDVPVATCLSGGIDSSAVAVAMHYLKTSGTDCGERSAVDWQNSFVATFPGTFLDEQKYAQVVIKRIGATPHYLPIGSDCALPFIVENVWCLDEPTAGLATSVWMLYRLMRERQIVVSLDGHGGDELLGGYAWYMNTPHALLNRTLYSDFHYDLLPTILRNYDRCSMAHGIEVRMPLMDYRLVALAHALPASAKLGGGFTKRILRDATRDLLPEQIRTRQGKIGFNSPLIEWLNGDLVHLLEKVFNHDAFLSLPHFDTKQIREEILTRCRAKSWRREDWDLAYKVTVLLNLSVWRMLFIERCGTVLEDWLPRTTGVVSEHRRKYECREVSDFQSAELDVVCLVKPGRPSPDWVGVMTALADAQANKPLECGVRLHFDPWPETPGALMKNRCGGPEEYVRNRARQEVFVVLDPADPLPESCDRIIALRGLNLTVHCASDSFSTATELIDKLLKLITNDPSKDKEQSPPAQRTVPAASVNVLVSQALDALKNRDINGAQVLIDEALEFNISVRDLYFVKGLICLELRQITEAKAALSAELAAYPERTDVQVVLSEILPQL